MTNNRQPNKKIIIDILRLFSPYRKRIVIIIISIIFTSLISIFTPLIRQILIDDGIIKNDIKTVGFITLVMLLFVIVNLLFEYIEMVNSTYITQMVPFNLLKECFDKMLRLKMAYYDNTNYYKVIENIKFDISTITTIVDQSTFLILVERQPFFRQIYSEQEYTF
ncbi:ABC transporter transmembrane domain-containing protein [Tissierella pigra]|uniref:ABC transporter ATP-binding protein n=1 Tax=Tissierella pigra TaxID=2607614 RepID=A0A6N7XZ84_9FIRM|nr:ABC transporter transmembrane domain-containing protein [Tissierella pigra]MSU03147.1 ABC transporter ATP-binding protein [Tissierella pigra]